MFGIGLNRAFAQPAENPTIRNDCIVVAYHPLAREIGYSILSNGGNAVDAFVAVTAAENVLAEGASSFAGPLGALLYERDSKQVTYLDADFNDPLSSDWKWHTRLPAGMTFLVPGAPAGLEAFAARYGTRPLGELLKPAMELADRGFPVSNLMAIFLRMRAKVLKTSEYGRKTYFDSSGQTLKVGATLRLPAVASFLSNLGTQGAAYVYEGDWSKQFLSVVRNNGGLLEDRDLQHYGVRWEQPWTTRQGELNVISCSGRSYGGLWGLLALNTVQHANLPRETHYSSDPQALATIVHLARQVWAESWSLNETALDDRLLVESRLTSEYAATIWGRVRQAERFTGIQRPGTHSYQILVVDKEGNAVNGTTTIESEPWGTGTFVEGVPLSPAGAIPWNTSPGARRLSPFSMHMVLCNGELRFASGAISNSAVETSFQFLVNLTHYGLDVHQAVTRPRFGTFPFRRRLDFKRNWLNPTIEKSVASTAQKTGLKFKRRGIIDTGLGGVVSAREGVLSGAVAPIPYVKEPFKTTAR